MKRILLVLLCLTIIIAGGAYIYMSDRETVDYSNEMFVDRGDIIDGYASMHTVYQTL